MRVLSAAKTIAVILLLLYLVSPSLQPVSAGTVLFSDGFESYIAAEKVTSPRDCTPPGNGAWPCNIYAPPAINRDLNEWPEYWVPASSTQPCLQRGGCVTWARTTNMGPNSIYAVVTERSASGINSLKLGASDWATDKTSASVHIPAAWVSSGGLLTWTFKVWLSEGVQTPGNVLTFKVTQGTEINYKGGTGLWQFESQFPPEKLTDLGNYPIAVETWHTITETLNLSNGTYGSLIVDGFEPFAALNGKVAPYKSITDPDGKGPYFNPAVWIAPARYDNQSIYYKGSSGLYAYIDDVTLNTTLNVSVSTTPITSTLNTATNTSESLTTANTQSIPEIPGFPIVSILAGILVGIAAISSMRRRGQCRKTQVV